MFSDTFFIVYFLVIAGGFVFVVFDKRGEAIDKAIFVHSLLFATVMGVGLYLKVNGLM